MKPSRHKAPDWVVQMNREGLTWIADDDNILATSFFHKVFPSQPLGTALSGHHPSTRTGFGKEEKYGQAKVRARNIKAA